MLNKKKDFIWNILGSIVFAGSYPLLTIVVANLFNIEISGEFSLLFSTAQILLMIGNYSVRVYQISDITEKFSYEEYKIHRYMTCILMLLIGIIFYIYKKYSFYSILCGFLLCIYKMFDALADVYESRLQQKGKLYKSGQSLFVRTVLSIMSFVIIAYKTNNLIYAISGAIIISIICCILFAILPANRSINGKRKVERANLKQIFIDCFPIFISTFVLQYIINSSKYAMEGVMNYEYQIYFNALYFPAMVLNLFSGMIFRPYIVMMAEAWNSKEKFNSLQKFSKKIVGIVGFIILFSIIAMEVVGLKIIGVLYKIDLTPYKNLEVLMLISGGLISIINYLYHILTIIRKQRELMFSYGIAFLIAIVTSKYLVIYFAMTGAVLALVFTLIILCAMLLFFYINSVKKQKYILKI